VLLTFPIGVQQTANEVNSQSQDLRLAPNQRLSAHLWRRLLLFAQAPLKIKYTVILAETTNFVKVF
jgi:hypothetical protein